MAPIRIISKVLNSRNKCCVIKICRTISHSNLITPIPEFEECQNSYQKLIEKCKTDEGNRQFWQKVATKRVLWREPFSKVSETDFEKGINRWFIGGKLNACENCVDRHALVNPDKTAIIWEKDEPGQEERISYKQLLELTSKLSNLLIENNVKKHDVVIIYMPNTPMVVASMLACVRIGAAHSVVFAGFSPNAIAARIMDAQASIVITADQAVRGGKVINLKQVVDEAIAKCPEDTIKAVLVQRRTGSDSVKFGKKDLCLDKVLPTMSKTCPAVTMDAEDMLYILYTSGSTGKPKGVVHSTAGYLLYAGFTHEQVFDFKADSDIFGCVADVGWVTGHSYIVYGPLFNGGTTLTFESTPLYPDPGRYWEMVERLRLTHIYLAPTALRLLIKHGDDWVNKYDKSSLRKLGCVGEPLNSDAWEWYHRLVGGGRCDIVDTWWQTETGGIVMSPRPSGSADQILPGMPMRPLPGIEPVLFDLDSGLLINRPGPGNEAYGALALARSWPGIAQTLRGDHDRFVNTYFRQYPGYFFTGDGCQQHMNDFYQITGRIDDVINTSGHRIGTAEMEELLNEHSYVAESAVVGFPHSVKGEGIYAFVTLKNEAAHLLEVDNHDERVRFVEHLRFIVRQGIAGYAVPDHILVAPALPKTRSGKIMRRILRKISSDATDDLGDTSTLSNPEIVDSLISIHKKLMSKIH